MTATLSPFETQRGAPRVQTAPYGTWTSPLAPSDLSGSTLGFSDLRAADDALYWLEYRPQEQGRSVVMRRDAQGRIETLTPDGFNVRSRVHEYGGTPYVVAGDTVVFSHYSDQRLYRRSAAGAVEALTGKDAVRFADCVLDGRRGRLIGVREDHRPETLKRHGEAQNAIVAVDLSDGRQTVLVEGADFFAYPRLNADGTRLAWTAWSHPNMPWDRVHLYVGTLTDDGPVTDRFAVNGDERESVLQPAWAPDGDLYFTADRSGFWSLYRLSGETVVPVLERGIDLGGPLWSLGDTWFDFLPDGRIVGAFLDHARAELAVIEPASGSVRPLKTGGAELAAPTVVAGRLHALATFPDRLCALVEVDPESGALTVLREAGTHSLPTGFISKPSHVSFPTSCGETAHAIYYPPTNPHFTAPDGEKPPLIVTVHGGPTGHRTAAFRLDMQFWTTRGFAVLDVNYRGSTGFGRAYRERLYGDWGLADVEDAVRGARYLAEQGLADENRLLIRGGSAGGYVVLAAMAFHDVFAAGANYYGVSDAEALAKDTHKFESRYLDQLIGPYPERRDLYVERSPIHHLEGFTPPLITHQGTHDNIVPPNQSEAIVNALRAAKVPVAYITFPEEQHGFRKAENRERALEAELSFYGRILGFEPAGPLRRVDIENLTP